MDMTLKIYELLGFIKDSKVPKEINYKNFIYGWVQKYKTYTRYDITGKDLYIITNNLNDEVEIIEEPKKIEKIARCDDVKMTHYGELYKPTENEEILRIKYNELIDEINNLKEN